MRESKKHDPEKLADFSDKIMRESKEHDPEKLADSSDKIMRESEKHDREKLADSSDKIMRESEKHDREKPQTFPTRSCEKAKNMIAKNRRLFRQDHARKRKT